MDEGAGARAPAPFRRYGKDGAQGRNRTTDTVIFSHVLYQLSYLGVPAEPEASAYRGAQRSLSSPSFARVFGSAGGPGTR